MFSFYVALISGVLLLCFSILFFIEERRGDRVVLIRFRGWLDRKTERIAVRFDRMRDYFGTGSLRAMFHFALHGVISRLVRMSEWMGTNLRRLERRNRRMARQVRAAYAASHLSAIAEHKATTALTEEERIALKERMLEGDL